MRVLTIFIDMIRANRLQTFNLEVEQETPLDKAFRELGGTVYTNCFTPGPDTPRGIASYYTGLPPYVNGCTTRLKWPEYFLKPELKNVFDLFLEKGYALNIFSSPNEKKNGFLPKHIAQMDIHNHDYDLAGYLADIELREDHFVFVSLPDYHWAFDDYGYSIKGEGKAYIETKKSYDVIFNQFDKDDFDHIFIFSDHGFKFLSDFKMDDSIYMLDEDRINSIMIHRTKGQDLLTQNAKLCSLCDVYASYQDILGDTISHGISLLDSKEHPFVIVEDHISFAPQVNQNIELWAVVKPETLYIRALDRALLIDRSTREEKTSMIEESDNILKENSSFGQYIDEYEKIFLYKENIVFDKSLFMNGTKRAEKSNMFKYYYIGIDMIKKIVGNKRKR
jgi:hypothetical protein